MLIGVIADDKAPCTMTAKVSPARAPTADTISDGEVSILDVPAPSTSRVLVHHRAKGKGKAVTKSPEELRHIKLENQLERTALDLLQQVKEMQEWRVATYGDE